MLLIMAKTNNFDFHFYSNRVAVLSSYRISKQEMGSFFFSYGDPWISQFS